MPYELSFTKVIPVEDPDAYFNECCWGGDKIVDRLLPMVQERYSDIQDDQEDWGWFIWFKSGATKLAIDVFCDDPDRGEYRIFLTSQVRSFLLGYRIADTEELSELNEATKQVLAGWVDSEISETLLDKNHEPVEVA